MVYLGFLIFFGSEISEPEKEKEMVVPGERKKVILYCPLCKAPLKKSPPCICEYCKREIK